MPTNAAGQTTTKNTHQATHLPIQIRRCTAMIRVTLYHQRRGQSPAFGFVIPFSFRAPAPTSSVAERWCCLSWRPFRP